MFLEMLPTLRELFSSALFAHSLLMSSFTKFYTLFHSLPLTLCSWLRCFEMMPSLLDLFPVLRLSSLTPFHSLYSFSPFVLQMFLEMLPIAAKHHFSLVICGLGERGVQKMKMYEAPIEVVDHNTPLVLTDGTSHRMIVCTMNTLDKVLD